MIKMYDREYENVQLKFLSIAKKIGGKFLDVGCNNGTFTLKFANKILAKEIYGVDIHEQALRKAQKKDIICVKADVNEKLPFPNNFFDVILCNQVAEHLLNPDNLFEEIRRVLKKGGIVYISVPNLCALHNRIFVLLGMQPTSIAPSTEYVFGNPARGEKSNMWGPYRHVTAFSPAAFKEMLNFYGLRVEKYLGSGVYPFGGKVANLLSKLIPSFSVFQIALAVKK